MKPNTSTSSAKISRYKDKHWFRLITVFYKSLIAYIREGAFFHGAALAYYTLFAFVPIVYLASSIFGRIFGQKNMENIISDLFQNQVGIKDTAGIMSLLKGINFDKPNLFMEIFSIAILIYGCSAFLVSLKRSINDFFQINRKKRQEENIILDFISFRFLSIGMLALFALLVILFYFLQMFIFSGIENYIHAHDGFVDFSINLIQYSSSILCNSIIFTLIFKYIHDGKVEWKLAIRGGIVTSTLLFFSQLLIRYYLQHYFSLGNLGIVGSLFVFLAWVNYSAQIVFFGAKFTFMLGEEMDTPVG
ncbi:MAG: YihY/virulence factor BrkB family protein [Crocinitomicaceae bacterium]|nr:YihY/virulence factor BrkB family protein [Crocinitomicaceae bacterium]